MLLRHVSKNYLKILLKMTEEHGRKVGAKYLSPFTP